MKLYPNLRSAVENAHQPSRKALRRLRPDQWHELTRPGLHELRVAHDDWCSIFKGPVCKCNPEMTVIEHG
jgi:hypothetical protein